MKIVELAFKRKYTEDFSKSDTYFYRVPETIAVEEEDMVYIENMMGPCLGLVVKVHLDESLFYAEYNASATTPEVFKVIDLTEEKKRKQMAKQLEEYERQMQEAIKSLAIEQQYKNLADLNPAFKEIYEKRQELKIKLDGGLLLDPATADNENK